MPDKCPYCGSHDVTTEPAYSAKIPTDGDGYEMIELPDSTAQEESFCNDCQSWFNPNKPRRDDPGVDP
jgi:hypothetical protein